MEKRKGGEEMYLVVVAEPVVAFVGNNDACLFGVDGREGEVLKRGEKWVLKNDHLVKMVEEDLAWDVQPGCRESIL